LKEVGDPATGKPIGSTEQNLKSAVEGETYEFTQMYPGFAKTARSEGFDEIAEWFETLAKAEKSHAGRFGKGLTTLSQGGGLADRHGVAGVRGSGDPQDRDGAGLRHLRGLPSLLQPLPVVHPVARCRRRSPRRRCGGAHRRGRPQRRRSLLQL